MRLGIFIGSFNPPHLGHLDMMNYLLDKSIVDKVCVVPTGDYWDKNNLIDISARIDMLKFYENDNIFVDNINNNYQYTYQLMRRLSEVYKNDELYLVIGADNIINFDKWKNYEELLSYNIIIMNRGNVDILKYILKFKGKFNVISDYKFIDISSTEIRRDVYKYKKYLDERVFKYVIDNKLYGGSYE